MREYLHKHIIKIFIIFFLGDVLTWLIWLISCANDNLAGNIMMPFVPFILIGGLLQFIVFIFTLVAMVPSNLIVDRKVRTWCRVFIFVNIGFILYFIKEMPNSPL